MFPSNDEKTWFILTSVEIAILGGIVEWLNSKEHHWFGLIVNIVTAGFVGLLVGEICLHYDCPPAWSYFMAGAAGVASEAVLMVFKQCVVIRLEMLLSEDARKKLKEDVYTAQLGELLQERFGVSEADVELALTRQKVGKMKIGEILVAQGVISRETLDAALEEQAKRNAKKKKKKKDEEENDGETVII